MAGWLEKKKNLSKQWTKKKKKRKQKKQAFFIFWQSWQTRPSDSPIPSIHRAQYKVDKITYSLFPAINVTRGKLRAISHQFPPFYDVNVNVSPVNNIYFTSDDWNAKCFLLMIMMMMMILDFAYE